MAKRTTEAQAANSDSANGIVFRCDTCDTLLPPVPIALTTEQQAAHRKPTMVVYVQPDTAALAAAVTDHRRRGCPAPHLSAVTDDAPDDAA
jgi:hypothetical protein